MPVSGSCPTTSRCSRSCRRSTPTRSSPPSSRSASPRSGSGSPGASTTLTLMRRGGNNRWLNILNLHNLQCWSTQHHLQCVPMQFFLMKNRGRLLWLYGAACCWCTNVYKIVQNTCLYGIQHRLSFDTLFIRFIPSSRSRLFPALFFKTFVTKVMHKWNRDQP